MIFIPQTFNLIHFQDQVESLGGSYKKLDFCDSKINRLTLDSTYKDLIAAFFPTGTLDYFDIVKTTTDSTGLSIYL